MKLSEFLALVEPYRTIDPEVCIHDGPSGRVEAADYVHLDGTAADPKLILSEYSSR